MGKFFQMLPQRAGTRRVTQCHRPGWRGLSRRVRPACACATPTRPTLLVIADLIRALAEYERLTHEIEWTEDELAATLFGPEAVPRVVLAEPTDPPGPAVGLAVWFPTYSTFLGPARHLA